jgi:hypothetical protein
MYIFIYINRYIYASIIIPQQKIDIKPKKNGEKKECQIFVYGKKCVNDISYIYVYTCMHKYI